MVDIYVDEVISDIQINKHVGFQQMINDAIVYEGKYLIRWIPMEELCLPSRLLLLNGWSVLKPKCQTGIQYRYQQREIQVTTIDYWCTLRLKKSDR